jgi:hypothetical protein
MHHQTILIISFTLEKKKGKCYFQTHLWVIIVYVVQSFSLNDHATMKIMVSEMNRETLHIQVSG